MKRLSEFIKAILAGAAISVGGIVFLSCDVKYVGAFLFSTGLVTVCMFGFNLYTGKIGYVLENDRVFFIDTLLSIIGNCVGCLLIGIIKSPVGSVVNICSAKLEKAPLAVLVDAALCGLLIFICVDIFKKKKTIAGILLCIPTFILCGFEHSIADMFYFINARMINSKSVVFILIVVAGNAIGGLFIPVMMKLSKKLSGEKAEEKA